MPSRINIPPVTRVLLAALLFQSALSAGIRYRQWTANADIVIPYLTIVPHLSINAPWTLVTSTFVESNVFTLVIAAVTLYQGGRYLERAWSSKELIKFIALVSLLPNILTLAVIIFLFAFTHDERWLLTVISGTVPVQIAFLVAFSQLVPAHTVTLFRGILSLRVPRFPLVHLGTVTVLSLMPILSNATFWLALFGFLTSWTYLRFYKPVFPDLDASQPSSLRGDASETFAFAEFFPAPVKPYVATFSDQVFRILVSLRLCAPLRPDGSLARGDRSLHRGAPGSARAEAERRRTIALKALDQRLNAAAAANSAADRVAPPPVVAQPAAPTVETQPQPSTQIAMTTQPEPLLGETKLEPNHDEATKSS